MTYMDQALLSRDGDFHNRIAAAAQLEVDLGNNQPQTWATYAAWAMAASPGFAEAYGEALAAGVPRPAASPDIITDAMILSAIQALPIVYIPPPNTP